MAIMCCVVGTPGVEPALPSEDNSQCPRMLNGIGIYADLMFLLRACYSTAKFTIFT
jgi:hypothetical protein